MGRGYAGKEVLPHVCHGALCVLDEDGGGEDNGGADGGGDSVICYMQ